MPVASPLNCPVYPCVKIALSISCPFVIPIQTFLPKSQVVMINFVNFLPYVKNQAYLAT